MINHHHGKHLYFEIDVRMYSVSQRMIYLLFIVHVDIWFIYKDTWEMCDVLLFLIISLQYREEKLIISLFCN